MKLLCQLKQHSPTAIVLAGHHHGKSSHEEARTALSPPLGIECSGHYQLDEALLMVAIDA